MSGTSGQSPVFQDEGISWKEFLQGEELPWQDKGNDSEWIFRGGLLSWGEIKTSLERACDAWGIEIGKGVEVEGKLLREFKRHPEGKALVHDLDDDLACLAAMQHYGAPTRLLDCTYSPFIAAYFALAEFFGHKENHKENNKGPSPTNGSEEERPVVWALETHKVKDSLRNMLSWEGNRLLTRYEKYRKPGDFRKLFMKKHRKLFMKKQTKAAFVCSVTPMSLNPRLGIQQGAFLCPANVSKSLMANLSNMRRTRGSAYRYILPAPTEKGKKGEMYHLFRQLHQMNVTALTLFPGSDGYCKDLKHRLKLLFTMGKRK
jgi:hypothetical protein